MDYLFYQVAAINGFDAYGHYLRAGLHPQRLLAVRDRGLARTAWRRSTTPRGSARAASATASRGYADTRRSLAAPLDAYCTARRCVRRRRLDGARPTRDGARPPAPRRDGAPRAPPRRRAPATTAPAPATAGGRPRRGRRPGPRARPGVGAARLPARGRRLMRRGSASIAANPVLIGAATTLVVIVAVFLAYNANSGLPFVPTYELKTQVPNAANLVKGNDVRIGGTRVGAVTDITPVTAQDGSVTRACSRSSSRPRQAAAGRLDRAHPPALGAGPEVRRDHEGHVEPGLRGRRDDPAAQRDARSPSRSTRSSTRSTTRRARRRRAT